MLSMAIIPFRMLVAQIYSPEFLSNGCINSVYFHNPADSFRCKGLSYKLVFEDNFEGTELNKHFWQTSYPWGRSLYSKLTGTGWERQYYADENVSVKDGYLFLHTKVDPGTRSPNPSTSSIFFNFTSGMVFSVPKFTKGKFEIRCKIPTMNGLFPAFWLYGYCAQEIDIFEFINSSATSDPATDAGHLITTYHRQIDCTDPDKGICQHGGSRKVALDLSRDFHHYSLEWNEYKIVWRLDGVITREVYKYWANPPSMLAGSLYEHTHPIKSCQELEAGQAYTVFDPFPVLTNPLHLIINAAVLKERAAEPGALPQNFLIDYVRAFEEIESDSIPLGHTHFSLSIFPNPGTGMFSFPEVLNGKPVLQITILNVLGNSVAFSQHTNDGLIHITLLNPLSGIYYLKVDTSDGSYLAKIVVN